MSEYAKTGEKMHQVKVLDDNGIQQGEALMLTDTQAEEMVDQLPKGWAIEVEKWK